MNKNNVITVLGFMVVCGLLVGGISIWLGGERTEKTEEAVTSTNEEFVAPLNADELAAYQATMTNDKNPVAEVVTNEGTFKLELFEDTMPITAGNFIKLAEEGFYNGVQFHRVIPGFMIQGGDPITKTKEYLRYGTGGPGYSIPDEHIVGEYLTNVRGTISMANSGPNSGGSQFFINVADNTNLDFDKQPLSSKHPVFGRIIDGMDTIDAISLAPTNERDLPVEPIVIESITITRS
jgi:peptidylprolyl isomerase